MAFVESWELTVPDWHRNYHCIHLAARPATAGKGRNSRGIVVFVKKTIRVSGIEVQRVEFGDVVQFMLNDELRIVIVYRDSAKRTLYDY